MAEEPDEFVTAREIGPLFKRGPKWFERNRDRLDREGFPQPVSRGTWLRSAVIDFRNNKGRARNDGAAVTLQRVDIGKAIDAIRPTK